MMTTDTTPAAIEALMKDVTPGPWRIDGPPWNQIIWSGAENRLAFMAHSNGLDDARDIATGRFIAAARDLVPALAAERDAALRERDEAEFRETLAATKAVEYLDRAEKSEAEAAARIRSALTATPAQDWLSNCAICGRVVDTREISAGGDSHGCEYDNGWACSSECAEKLNPDPDWMKPTPAQDVAGLVEMVRSLRDAICSNIVQSDTPHTVVLPDGSRHSGPVVDFLHALLAAQVGVLDTALARMKEDFLNGI